LRDDKAIPDGLDVVGGIGGQGAGVKGRRVKREAKTSVSNIELFE